MYRTAVILAAITVTSLALGAGAVTAQDSTEAPRLVEKSDDDSRVYVSLAGSDEVLVINTSNDDVVRRVSSYGDDPRDMEPVSSDRLLVSNWGGGNVTLVNPQNGNLVKSFDVGTNPWALDETTTESRGRVAVVASWSGKNGQRGTVTFINTSDFVIDDDLQIPSTNDGGPWGVATCPPPKPIYITNDGNDMTYQVTLDPFEIKPFGTGELPWEHSCAADPNSQGSILAIANGGSDQVEPGDDPLVENLTVDGTAEHLAWNQPFWESLDGVDQFRLEKWWDAMFDPAVQEFERHRKGESTYEIVKIDDQGDFKSRTVVPVGTGSSTEPWATHVDPGSGTVYGVDMHLNKVHVISSQDGSFQRNFSTCEAPRDAISANKKLYVGCSGTHQISTKGESFDYSVDVRSAGAIDVFDLETGSKQTTIELGSSGQSAVDQYDTDGDGIDTAELQAAIQDFLANSLDTAGLQAVIQDFLTN